MANHQYYMLLSSLPALQRFDLAERLPISRERLTSRMTMLHPEDAELLKRATNFFAWFRQSATLADDAMTVGYQGLAELVEARGLMKLFGLPINLRTIIAALRRRLLGREAPRAGENWGAGPLVPHIVRHYEAADFGLQAVYPWITEVRHHIEAGAARDLEKLMCSLIWKHFDRPYDRGPFGIEALTAYLFKWSVLDQWLSQDRAGALNRFDQLVAEVTGQWEAHFNGI
ncbi:MAG: DUF2764 family protein [Myxococcota bacterium]|nr:DUF2764 family protein [Myxococcota bacterium]